jgi:hypothetical protein
MVLPVAMNSQVAWIEVLQNAAPGLTPLTAAASLLVTQQFYLLFIPLVLWCYNRTLGKRLIVLLTVNTINSALKILFSSPRPYWAAGR